MKSIVVLTALMLEPLSTLRRPRAARAHLILTPTKIRRPHLRDSATDSRESLLFCLALDPDEALATASQSALPRISFGRVFYRADGRQRRYKGMDTLISALPRSCTSGRSAAGAVGEHDQRARQLAEGAESDATCIFSASLIIPQLAAFIPLVTFSLAEPRGSFAWCTRSVCEGNRDRRSHGGAPEVIDDGRTGYLVQHGDAPQLPHRSKHCWRIRNWPARWAPRTRAVKSPLQVQRFSKSLKRSPPSYAILNVTRRCPLSRIASPR